MNKTSLFVGVLIFKCKILVFTHKYVIKLLKIIVISVLDFLVSLLHVYLINKHANI